MDYTEFCKSIAKKTKPANLHPNLEALWLEASGEWDAAHRIVQSRSDRNAEWIHAYLHRVEGDRGNASYWYGRCGRNFPSISIKDEWELIAKDLLSKSTVD